MDYVIVKIHTDKGIIGMGDAPTDSVEVRTPATTEIRAREMEVRQQAVTTASARAEAFERISTALDRTRAGEQGSFEALRAAVETGGGTVQTGPNLAQLLLRVSPSSAQAVDPGLVETAMVEIENSLAATYGVDTLQDGLIRGFLTEDTAKAIIVPEHNIIGWLSKEIKAAIPNGGIVVEGPRVYGGMTLPVELIMKEIHTALGLKYDLKL